MNGSVEQSASLTETVIQGDYCIGCGACTAVSGSRFSIGMNELGMYQAIPGDETDQSRARFVCPFSADAGDENAIGHDLYGSSAQFDEHIGYHLASYIGYVEEGGFRARGSSGGIGKWILHELLRLGHVDRVIQIVATTPEPEDGTIYSYSVTETADEVLSGSKSVYYPVEMSGALNYIRDHPGRYAITGIPCFVKALRLLSREEPVFEERIVFCVGLICGHLKSRRYADMIGWQFGIEPGRLAHIDFRKKLPGTRANEKGVTVRGLDENNEAPAADIVQNLFGTDYNHGFFQYNACNYCDDVVGETADVSVGDAWLEEYMKDGSGTSVVVVRHPTIRTLIERALDDGRLHAEPVDATTVARSQAGGFRQRRQGLSYRLQRTDDAGQWRPPKRVQPGSFDVDEKRSAIYDMRMRMTERSHSAFARALRENDFTLFKEAMEPLLAQYRDIYRPRGWERIRNGIMRRVRRVRKLITIPFGNSEGDSTLT